MFFVYVLASGHYGTLYVGSTTDLRAVFGNIKLERYGASPRHMASTGSSGSKRMKTLEGALMRERQIKEWKRDWKINLIERENPHWVDLYPSLSP
jgi:putative endonuclease